MAEKTFVLRAGDGSDIMKELEKLAVEKGIDYGLFVSGCGSVKDFELISTGSKGSVDSMKLKTEFQVNAVSGRIQKKQGGKFEIILRVSVTKTGFTPKGGQLIRGKAAGVFEIGIRKIDTSRIIES